MNETARRLFVLNSVFTLSNANLKHIIRTFVVIMLYEFYIKLEQSVYTGHF